MSVCQPLVSYIILTRNRAKDLAENLTLLGRQNYRPSETIVVINGPDQETGALLLRQFSWVRVILSQQNRGVAGGRNLGIQAARGEILVFIDDDASFRDERATERIVQYFKIKVALGVLAFSERSYFAPETFLHWGFPGRLPERDGANHFETYYFAGAGHAIRARALKQTGLYPERYFYSTEEKDLAYRMLECGYEIWYTPNVRVYHKVTPAGRNYDRDYLELRNHYWFSMRLLPWPQAVAYALFWTGYELIRTFPRVGLVTRSITEAMAVRKAVLLERKPVRGTTLAKMRTLRPWPGELVRRVRQLRRVLA
ncbi:MAG: glycosyltransferase [Parcubacteria group bacterium]